MVYEAVYNSVLKAGEKSPASLTKVKLAATATNEDMEALGGSYEIMVLSQAVQTAGFASAQTALDTAFGDVNDATAEAWFKGMEAPVAVASADELAEALAAGESVYLEGDITLDAALAVSEEVSIYLNGHELSTVGLKLAAGGSIENGTVSSAGNTNMTPHLSVTGGTLEMKDVVVEIDHYLNYQAQSNRAYGEYTGLEVANATAVLDKCTVKAANGTYRTWNYVYGITVNSGSVTMNGGSIVVKSAGASSTDLKTAISGMGTSTVTLNDVVVEAETYGTTMGDLTVNTTDRSITEADFVSYGGTYKLNFIS